MLLALDTASRQASVALFDGEQLISEATWHSARQHTMELMPRVVAMLGQAGLLPRDLTAVGVALGPGSFTGLRVALSVAKGLAAANDMALLGVPTLDVVAYPHRWQPWPVCALVQAGRGRVCWALYSWRGGTWEPRSEYRLSSVDEVCAIVSETEQPTLMSGEILPSTAALLQALGDRIRLASPAATLRRAGYLAELAWLRLQRGEMDDPASLAPIYLDEPTAARAS